MIESFDSIISAINQENTKKLSYTDQVYPIIYEHITSTPIQNIISNLENIIENHFQDFIIENDYNKSIDTFLYFLTISKEFIRYKRIICNLFCLIERYTTHQFSISSLVDKIFIQIFRSLTNFEELLFSFFEKLNNFHFTDFKCNPEFNDLVIISKTIHFCYQDSENRKILTELLLKETAKSAHFFTQNLSDTNITDFVISLNKYLTIEKQLLKKLFYLEDAKASFVNVYNGFISVSNSVFERISGQLKESCKNRDETFIKEYFTLITFRQPPESLLTSLSESIHDQIKSESIESITAFADSIKFYNELFESMNYPFLTRKYNSQIIESINGQKKPIFKELISFISKQSLTNSPDLSPIFPVLSKIDNKGEFKLLYSRHAVGRLVPPTEKQIEREKSIIEQIQSIFGLPTFEFSTLLKEASQSIEWNFGPVLICNSSIWPFKPPFPYCSYFDKVCEEIREKYKSANPCRMLTFPFDSWAVVIKDTLNNYFLSGNAVQAQVFLHLNARETVHQDSFSPAVSGAQLASVLKSLSSKKLPVLIEKHTNKETAFFCLNPGFKNKMKVVKLPVPASVYKAAQRDAVQARNEQIDATATRLMKEKRVMGYLEFESEVIQRLSNRFRAMPDEIKSRVNELVAREFFELNDENNSIVYLP